MIPLIAFQIGVIVGGLAFDMFVSRPTLRILNEQLKEAIKANKALFDDNTKLKFEYNNLKRIKQDDSLGNHK